VVVAKMRFSALLEFIRTKMKMSHIYQPFVISQLLESGGQATVRQLAQAMAYRDEALLLLYEDRINRYPMAVLKRHGVVTKDANGLVTLNVDRLTYEQRAELKAACEQRIGDFLSQRGLTTWDYSLIETDPVPTSIRYEVLKRDGGKCLLCGVSAKDKPLHVDHIQPKSKHGTNDLDNLQTLCWECNNGKGNKDNTNFRTP
jgi:hypothetical protein